MVGDGTDSHMVLLDLTALGIIGTDAENALAAANITSNKNPVPFDVSNPANWVGLRLGVAAATTRGIDAAGMAELAECIADLILGASAGRLDAVVPDAATVVAALCDRFDVHR